MKLPSLACVALCAALIPASFAHDYQHAADWHHSPDGLEHPGNSHGEIDVDSKGQIYVSISGGPKSGIQVYSPDGKYLHNVPNARGNHHGFSLVQEDGKDVIYAACLGGNTALIKLTTAGELLLEIPSSKIPESEWGIVPWNKKAGPKLALTHADVGPNGDIYIIDGYASDKIFVFDKEGNYKKRIAGKEHPHNFFNAHKFSVDRRYTPARLLVCDRNNRRLVHLDLEGQFLGVFKGDLLRPSSVAFYKDLVAVAEINGRVSVLDMGGRVVGQMGHNSNEKQVDTNKVKPEDWREGIVTSPHGITFDMTGNVIMTEWNNWGRILRWNAVEAKDIKKTSIAPARAFMDDSGPGWVSLGEEDFAKVNSADDTWSWVDGVLQCTGQPVSVMRTAKQYKNFEMVVEWSHQKAAGNSGLFAWVTPESVERLTKAGKPGLPDGIEIQMLDHGYTEKVAARGRPTDWFGTNGDVFAVRVDMEPFPPLSPNGSRSYPLKHLANGHGEWNHYYVRAINGEVRLWVNGEEVSGGTDIKPAQGYLCLESEGSPIHFRKLRIREIP